MTLRAMKRWLEVGGALVALSFGSFAAAAPQAETAPPIKEEQPEPRQEKLPPCPLPPKAAAAPEEAPPPAPQAEATPAPVPAPVKEHRHNRVFAPQQVSLVTGAGVGNYFGTGSPTLDAGATWDARVTFGAHSIIALEAGYVGASNKFDTTSNGGGVLNSNGLDGNFRLQLPFRIQPYIFSGVGYNHMGVDFNNNANVAAQVRVSDNQVTVPAGGGVAAYLGKNKHATLDLRGTYRYIPDNDISLASTRALHQWVAQARIGYAF